MREAATILASQQGQSQHQLKPGTPDFCPEASTRSVTRPSRSVATYRQLHGWILLPRLWGTRGNLPEMRLCKTPTERACLTKKKCTNRLVEVILPSMTDLQLGNEA
jgi:hypothetical protein